MKIGIDVTQAVYETGVAVYTREMVRGLVAAYPEHRYILYGGSLKRKGDLCDFVGSLGKHVKSVITPISPTIADFTWNRLHILPIEYIVGKCDVFHTSDWTEPPSKIPKVTTIHDFAPFKYSAETHPRVVAVHKRRLSWVIKESSAVIVPSLATKNDAIEYGIDERRIHVISEAPSGTYKRLPDQEVESVLSRYNIKGSYALAIGKASRKNIVRIIKAFTKAKKESGLDKLVVVGDFPENGSESVIYTGRIPTSDLIALHCGASVMVYASLYEGFGLPILESYACGCPVVTSNVSSMPEVAGEAAVLVDPLSVTSISEGIVKAINNSKQLINKGSVEVKKYTWTQTASETMKVYKQIAQQ